jgi:HNH endonuclease
MNQYNTFMHGRKFDTPKAELKRLYLEEKLTVNEISKKLKRHVNTIWQAMDRWGIRAIRPKGPRKGEKHPMWNGGRRFRPGQPQGRTAYMLILKPDHPHADQAGYVLEHRLVMEKILGRILKREERVHHIDGNGLNNDPKNLCLFKNHAEHMKFHFHEKKDVLHKAKSPTGAGKRRPRKRTCCR